MSSNQIKGREVVSSSGSNLGKVTGVNFDPETWQISSVEVSLEPKVAEQIGIKHRFERIGIGHTEIPLKASFLGHVGEKLLVKASQEELAKYVTDLRVDETTKQIKIPP
jgi:sporulation protein YlmC with PRC-barrel domain